MAGYSVTYTVVDNATKQIDAINRRITAMRAPMERLSKQVSRFVDVSGLNTIAKGFASIGRAAGSVLRTLVEIVPVLGTLTGAATIAGMAKLVGTYADWSQQLVSTADSMGMTTQQLQQFENAARLAGGRTQDMDAALKSLYDAQNRFIIGKGGDATLWANQLKINFRDATGQARSMADLFPEVERKVAAMENPFDRAAAATALLGANGNELIETFRRTHQSFGAWFTDASRYTALSDKQKEQLQAFSEAQGRIATAFDTLGQQISATLATNFTPLINKLSDFVEKNTPAILAAVDKISAEFAAWLSKPETWKAFEDGANSVVGALKFIIDHLAEIKTAAEVIAGIFATKWAFGMVASIAQVTAAIGSTSAGAGAVAGVGLLGALGAVAAIAAVFVGNRQGQKNIEGQAKEMGFEQRGGSLWNPFDKIPHFVNPKTGEDITYEEMMRRKGRADVGTGSVLERGATALGNRIMKGPEAIQREAPAAPLGLTPPAAGAAPASLSQLPGDYSWGDYGTRANNPGNMNYAPWENAAARYTYTDPQTGGGHTMAVYNTMQEGVADTYKLLARNQEKYGKTLAGALHGWAENSYSPQLAKSMGVDPNAEFDISKADPQSVARMMGEQFRREGRRGSHTATPEQIVGGINLARGDTAQVAQGGGPPVALPPAAAANGSVDVNITGKNLPPNTAITASGTGSGVNVPPPRVERQEMASI